MAAVARKSLLTQSAGERLLTAKLQILSGSSSRRTSRALGILTGRTFAGHGSDAASSAATDQHASNGRGSRQFTARTVYLAEHHLRDVDRIIDAWEQVESGRLNRSVVLRRAIEHLRTLVEAENE
jgi:hypothetical protein